MIGCEQWRPWWGTGWRPWSPILVVVDVELTKPTHQQTNVRQSLFSCSKMSWDCSSKKKNEIQLIVMNKMSWDCSSKKKNGNHIDTWLSVSKLIIIFIKSNLEAHYYNCYWKINLKTITILLPLLLLLERV
jgi:hypothetical protein